MRTSPGSVFSTVYWQDTSTGKLLATYHDGTAQSNCEPILGGHAFPGGYALSAVGDFDGDGNPDLLVREASTGKVLVVYMTGPTFKSQAYLDGGHAYPKNWLLCGVGDFNADGKPDIVWRVKNTGRVAVTYFSGSTQSSAKYANGGYRYALNHKLSGVGDFNADGKPDLLWRDMRTGRALVTYLNGVTQSGRASLGGGTAYSRRTSISGVGDFDGDGRPDLLWRDTRTGAVLVMYLNGVTQTGGDYLGGGYAYWRGLALNAVH